MWRLGLCVDRVFVGAAIKTRPHTAPTHTRAHTPKHKHTAHAHNNTNSYLFVRCDNAPAPWSSEDVGDAPRELPE